MPCDAAAVVALAEELRAAPPEEALARVARAWAPLCEGDTLLDQQIPQFATVAPQHLDIVDLQAFTGDWGAWNDACPAGWRALSDAMSMGPDGGRAHLWEGCELSRLAAFGEEEWISSRGRFVTPLLAWHVLVEGGADPTAIRPVVRALAGLPP